MADQTAQQMAVTGHPDRFRFRYLRLFFSLSGDAVIQHRYHQDRHEQRRDERERHRPGLILEQLARSPVQIHDRKENNNRRQRRSDNRPRHFRRTLDGRFPHRQSFLLVAEDTFDHHNGVVHQHPGTQRQTAQRHYIQRKPVKEHQVERSHDRDRDRHADDQCRTETAQENEQDHHRQNDTQHGTVFHLTDCTLDKRPLVGYHLKMITGQRLLDYGQLTGYAIHYLDRIITHFFIDGQPDTPFPVDADDVVGTCILE